MKKIVGIPARLGSSRFPRKPLCKILDFTMLEHCYYRSRLSKDIDDVFVNITKLYSIQDYNIIYNTLVLLEKNPQNYNDYINGINNILNPINSQIKKWINDNIVF